MNLTDLHDVLAIIWVVWFFVLFVGLVAWALRPGKKEHSERLRRIPMRDEA
jgi:cbb3-type cytochrome oxidase subunit 3